MKNWEFRFFLPGEKREDDGKTFGLTASECYPADAAMTVLGEAFGGSYESVLSEPEQYAADAKETIYSAMILFRENVGNEAFIKAFSALFPGVPCAGGTAAQTEEHGPRVLPGEGAVAVLLVGEPTQVFAGNVHEKKGSVTIECDGRYVDRIDGMDAAEWYRRQAARYTDGTVCYEQLTLSEDNGKNVHFTERDGRLYANAALDTEEIELRFSTRKGAQEAANRFANTPKTIVFGCAGVNTLLDERVTIGEGSLIGFLFSEVVTLGGKPAFANLMLSKIVFGGEPKQSQS